MVIQSVVVGVYSTESDCPVAAACGGMGLIEIWVLLKRFVGMNFNHYKMYLYSSYIYHLQYFKVEEREYC